jgi:hypothetical protein
VHPCLSQAKNRGERGGNPELPVLLYRKLEGRVSARHRRLAHLSGADPQVENRLIQQALYYLGGSRKHEIDRRFFGK